MPQAIYVNIIEDGKIIIEASSESWHWIPKMHTFRAAARHRRINSYKEACSESDCHDLDMLNEHLSKQHKGLDDRKRRDFITDWIKTNGNGPRKMLKVPGIAATFKCTGENKPARFLCRARFLPEPVLEAGSIKEAENMALYGYEDCAEVSGWFALRAGKA
ncbi:hypothetical protein RRF57_010480 [Xylaria bambusicola]|uniref:Uncharacterized protein n=1 Tax=Xylaria bambusicola TaxID=326684 RepID=A0AAN7USG5_9PEZI